MQNINRIPLKSCLFVALMLCGSRDQCYQSNSQTANLFHWLPCKIPNHPLPKWQWEYRTKQQDWRPDCCLLHGLVGNLAVFHPREWPLMLAEALTIMWHAVSCGSKDTQSFPVLSAHCSLAVHYQITTDRFHWTL